MRIVSGSSSNVVYFVGFRTSDHVTRSTGLTEFQTYAAINGSTGSTGFNITVTPSTRDATGIYMAAITDSTLTSLGAGVDNAELLLHITASSASANMDPVTRTIEVYRREVTTGQSLALNTSGKIADVESILSKVTSIDTDVDSIISKVTSIDTDIDSVISKVTSIDTDIDAVISKLTSVETDVDSVLSKVTSIDTDIDSVISKVTSIDTKVTSMNALFTSTVKDNLTLIYDTQFASVFDTTNNVWRGAAASLSTSDHEAIAVAVWDEAASSHVTAGTFGKHVGDIISKVTSIDTDIDSVISKVTSIDTDIDSVLSKVTSIDANTTALVVLATSINTNVNAVQAKTTNLTFTETGVVDANIQYVNDVQVQGTGTTVDTWRPV